MPITSLLVIGAFLATPGAHALAADGAQFSGGVAHLQLTEREDGSGETADLALASGYWDTAANPGQMYLLFGVHDVTRPASERGAALEISGPALIGTSTTIERRAGGAAQGIEVVVRRARMDGAYESFGAPSGTCTLTVSGSAATGLTGTLACHELPGVVNPALGHAQVTASFSVTPAAAPCGRSTGFALVLAGPCVNQVDLAIDHVELVQVVQDETNSVPLVAGRSTLVRVFLRVKPGATAPATGVTGSLLAEPAGSASTRIGPDNAPFTVPASANRGKLDDSLDFTLPAELALVGVYPITVTVEPPSGATDPDTTDNAVTKLAVFRETRPITVGFVRVGVDTTGKRQFVWPGESITVADQLAATIYPFRDGGLDYRDFGRKVWNEPLGTEVEANAFLARLEKRYLSLPTDRRPDHLMGWLPGNLVILFGDGSGRHIGGLGQQGALGYPSHLTFSLEMPGADMIMAHELGHNLGLPHTGTAAPNPPCTMAKNDIPGYWPYGSDGATHELGYDEMPPAEIVPATAFDIMSYCGAPAWISPFHYTRMIALLEAPDRAKVADHALDDLLLISGTVELDGRSAKLDPALRATGWPSPVAGVGATSDGLAASTVVEAAAATPTEAIEHCLVSSVPGRPDVRSCYSIGFESHATHTPLPSASFVFAIPRIPGTTKIALVRNGKELAALTGDGVAPVVTIDAPRAGDAWSGERPLAWSVTGATAATRYHVSWRAHGETEWTPLETDLVERSFAFDAALWTTADTIDLRVVAADGLDQGAAEVGPIHVVRSGGGSSGASSAPTAPPRPTGGSSPSTPRPPTIGSILVVAVVLGAGLVLVAAWVVIRRDRRRTASSSVPPGPAWPGAPPPAQGGPAWPGAPPPPQGGSAWPGAPPPPQGGPAWPPPPPRSGTAWPPPPPQPGRPGPDAPPPQAGSAPVAGQQPGGSWPGASPPAGPVWPPPQPDPTRPPPGGPHSHG